MSKQITITVQGVSGSGKTAIAEHIQATFKDLGFDTQYIDPDTPSRTVEQTEDVLGVLLDNGLKIKIEHKQTLRESYTNQVKSHWNSIK